MSRLFGQARPHGPLDVWALRLRGLTLLAVVAVVAAVWVYKPFKSDDKGFTIDVSAPSFADGVAVGTAVQMRGFLVGEVTAIDASNPSAEVVTLHVDNQFQDQFTSAAEVRYASRTLFGSDAIDVVPSPGGEPLIPGATLAFTDAIADYTITSTVRRVGRTTIPVLTPRLSEIIKQASADATQLAPFLTAGIAILNGVYRGQTTPLEQTLPPVADVLEGFGSTMPQILETFYLMIDNQRYNDQVYVGKVNNMLDAFSQMIGGAGKFVGGAEGFGNVLDLINAYVGPLHYAIRGVTADQIAQLIERADGAFVVQPGSDRVTLRADIDISVIPAVAIVAPQLLTTEGSGR
ncbi:MCE family protein [Nocardia uniformis]|uniref:MCE family protein n=1 Tax=Nocardia uniformis TaxID=53432 RepID=A0A849C3H7_9NOCA|nr:MlaD family protein [Nocardia uniformis]NNH70885.1 MCE family protein [Nocardia uniformis]